MLVLSLLRKEEMYGYQIIHELKVKSRERFLLKDGTLYPILYRLEDDGLVKSEWSEQKDKEISRKYYKITEDGQKTLIELRSLWHDFSKNVNQILGDNDDE